MMPIGYQSGPFYKPLIPDNSGKPLSQPFMMIDHEDAPMPEAMFQQNRTKREAYEQSHRRTTCFHVWGTQSLYVVDGSIFPTSVGANPMQSIYTIAKIFADHWQE